MKPPLDPIDSEYLRDEVEFHLVQNRSIAFPVSLIHRALTRRKLIDFPFTEEDVAREVSLLEQLKKVERVTEPGSVVVGYRATAEAIIAQGRRHVAG